MLGIRHPLFQGGMAWVADAKLAAAVSNAGGLGLIGAAAAPGDVVQAMIREAKSLTDKPFGVNVMLLSPFADDVARICAEEKVAVVTTGAGNPGKYMDMWKGREYGRVFIDFGCCKTGKGGEPCTSLLGRGITSAHQKKRAGAPLLYEGRRGTVQRDQEHERKGITVESN